MSDDARERRSTGEVAAGTRVVRAIGKVHERVGVASVSRLRAMGFDDVTPALLAAVVLVEAGGSKLADLRRHWGRSKQATSQLVELMRRRGYAQVEASDADGRSRIVALTARGLALRTCALAALGRLSDDVSRALGEEAAPVALALERLAEAFGEGPAAEAHDEP